MGKICKQEKQIVYYFNSPSQHFQKKPNKLHVRENLIKFKLSVNIYITRNRHFQSTEDNSYTRFG